MSDDPNPFVISGLIQKRAEVSGEVAKARVALERAIADLQAIDRALELVGYTEHAEGIPRKTRGGKMEKEAAEAMRAFIRRTLANSQPMRASAIAKRYRDEHGITGTDRRTAEYYRTKVLNGLRSLKTRGEAVMEGKCMGATWRLASPKVALLCGPDTRHAVL